MQLNVFNESATEPPLAELETLFERVMSGENAFQWNSEVNLVFCTDDRMQKLNNQYRNINQTTDVLSFNVDDPEEPESVFGEIYISLAVAVKQAQEYEVTLVNEIRRLFVHGLLHLLGFDHQHDKEAKLMFSNQEKYLGINGAAN